MHGQRGKLYHPLFTLGGNGDLHMNEWHPIDASESLVERPFTNPVCTVRDLQVMNFALDQLRLLFTDDSFAPLLDAGEQIFWLETGGRPHRLILCDVAALRQRNPLLLVGFFGQRRAGADPAPIDQVDNDLIGELMAHPGLLSYCSILLPDGEYGNIVLFDGERAKLHWSTSERHAYAARVLSPKYYESVRLHNGHLHDGLFAGAPPVIAATKYLDYRGMLPWRGMRVNEP